MTRKPKLELFWSQLDDGVSEKTYQVVNWRLIAGNGEVLCQCTQGFRDRSDALRNVMLVQDTLCGGITLPLAPRIVGPGRKP